MRLDRRSLLKHATMLPIVSAVPQLARAADDPPTEKPDYTLRIAPISLELAPGKTIKTTGYNDKVPGPVLRLRAGRPVTINVINDAGYPDIVHWHGLYLPALQDGATEEGSPIIPVGQSLVYSFTPKPSGTRLYHSHAMAMTNLNRSTYSGEFGFLIIEPAAGEPGRYDREVLLAARRWEGEWVSMQDLRKGPPPDNGLEVMYHSATLGERMLGHGEPSAYARANTFCFASSMPARPWMSRWHCRAIASPSSHSMAIPCRRQRPWMCCGWMWRNART